MLQPSSLIFRRFATSSRLFLWKRSIHSRPNNGYLQLSPWSGQFRGSQGTKVLLQALAYSAAAVTALEYFRLQKDEKEAPNPRYASQDDIYKAIQELREAFPDPNSVITDKGVLGACGSSTHSYHPEAPHAVLVRPKSTDEVVKLVNIARRYRLPVVPYSGATSLEGHFSGYPTGSLCVDLSGMDKIINVNVEDSDLTCQAGARWEDINQTLHDRGIGLFFPLDPGPGATIGGMISTGCSGTNAVRYGTARAEWFLNFTVVLPDGSVIKTRRRARKSAAGFDTTKLFIGAEGTLGIVTEATLRLTPVLPTKVAMAQFQDVGTAVSAVQEILSSPHGPHLQCIELVDDHMMQAINDAGFVEHAYPVKDTLFFKIQGNADLTKQVAGTIASIVKKHQGHHFAYASTEEQAEELWHNRKYALMSTIAANPGHRCWTTDVCVPVSQLPRLIKETKADFAEHGLRSTIVGHVGDGNFHAFLLFKDDKDHQLVEEAVHRLVHRALALDGTCTGEHGVGIGKKEYLVEELGPGTVELMRKIKHTLDPLNIMNPGKLYPEEATKTSETK